MFLLAGKQTLFHFPIFFLLKKLITAVEVQNHYPLN